MSDILLLMYSRDQFKGIGMELGSYSLGIGMNWVFCTLGLNLTDMDWGLGEWWILLAKYRKMKNALTTNRV